MNHIGAESSNYSFNWLHLSKHQKLVCLGTLLVHNLGGICLSVFRWFCINSDR